MKSVQTIDLSYRTLYSLGGDAT